LAADLKPFQDYIRAIEKALVAGDATEHTHRLSPVRPEPVEGSLSKEACRRTNPLPSL
jgi:hypothetical protein